MSSTIFTSFARNTEEGNDDFNNNSFLSRSANFCNAAIENLSDEEVKNVEDEEMNVEVSHNDDPEEHKDIDVGSINMEDNFKTNDAGSIGQYSCHLCSFVCVKKAEFQEHLLTHYTYSCNQCDYASRTEGRLKRHVKDFHSSNSPENFSGQKVPSNNPKSLKCKHCGIISSTKEKHWSHQRTHLDVNKCLQCPKCPFITEYKHHLEYHIRNHEKIKPYKCSKCQYRCVNKSMLNSHKKSHSNVYQFRCADCSYASKYCHSLKQHLSRHDHQPAPVLNEDGSLPTYDNSNEILAMKRGPNNRNLSSHNSANSHQETSCNLPAATPTLKQDSTVAHSAFSVFKKDQMDSLLGWTLNHCYPMPLTRFLSPTFPLMPPLPSLLSPSTIPTMAMENLFHNSQYQSLALDLSVKTKLSSADLAIQDNLGPASLECAVCHMRFCDQKLLESHTLCHGRLNHFRCNKCGDRYTNALDFFTHISQTCRQ